jgi:hypothetical protein
MDERVTRKMTRYLFVLLLACVILTGCDYASDPKRIAVQIEAQGRADRMEALTAEEVADMVQARALENQREQIAIREQDIRQAQLTQVGSKVLPFLGVSVVIVALGLALSIAIAAVGASTANSIKAVAGSLKVYPDANGNYPLLQYPKKATPMLVNPNHHSALDTGKEHRPVPQLVTAHAYAQATTILADRAKKADDPATVAIIRPAMIEAQPARTKALLEENHE